jgi:hypothetical protein
MGFLQPLSTVTDVIAVGFILGFGAAALVFLPMVRRARDRLAAQRATTHSLSRGAQALRDPSALRIADSTTASATAITVLAAKRQAENQVMLDSGEDTPHERISAMKDQANADLPTAPQTRITDQAEGQLPTDLFGNHYGAQFDNARKRIERMRAELND